MEISLKERLLAHFRSPDYQPQNKSELARTLAIPSAERADLRQILRELTGEGIIHEGRRSQYLLQPKNRGLIRGTLMLRPGGGGFVAPDFEDKNNASLAARYGLAPGGRVPISAENTGTAMHGNSVLVKIDEKVPPVWWKHVQGKREELARLRAEGKLALEARVAEILERRSGSIVGTLHRRGKFAWVAPDDPLLPPVIEIQTDEHTESQHGDKVLLEVEHWPTRHRKPRGKLVKRIGGPRDPGLDVLSLIYRYALPLDFPPEVLHEAEAIPSEITAEDLADREDWRSRDVVTIDPFDARDFDDAICVTPLDEGGWELAVHIADVSHYVRPQTALDREARKRGNSVYLVDRVLPMLPERISNGLCSLRPHEDHLTRAAILRFDSDGRRTASRFVKSVIRSVQRYTYEEAFAEMQQQPTGRISRAWQLASRLRQRRFRHGALDLDFPEVKVMLDAQGRPLRLAKITHDESHQLIEEFMLAANEAVAEQIRQTSRPGIYRIHEDPDDAKLEDLRAFLAVHGIRTGDLTVRGEMQKALRQIAARPDSPVLKLAVLKSLKRAAYHADPLGHFGLAMANYTHFTSPIRRYSDLVVHRIQANLLWADGGRTPEYGQMQEIARHLSDTERLAADAETESRRLKELEYFDRQIRSGQPDKFRAAIMDVKRFGLFIELAEVLTRGLVRPEDFGTPHHEYDGRQNAFRLYRPNRTLSAGNVIDVRPVRIDRERRVVEFGLC